MLRGPQTMYQGMKNRIKEKETYEKMDWESEVIHILLLIKSITYSYESKSYPILVIYVALRKFYSSY